MEFYYSARNEIRLADSSRILDAKTGLIVAGEIGAAIETLAAVGQTALTHRFAQIVFSAIAGAFAIGKAKGAAVEFHTDGSVMAFALTRG
jgi:hypothetical protein